MFAEVTTRLIPASLALYLLIHNLGAFMRLAQTSPSKGLHFYALMTGRVCAILFIALGCALFLVRLRPVRKASGIKPRVVAVIGTTMGFLMLVVPQSEPTLWQAAAGASISLVGHTFALLSLYTLGRSFSIMAEARRLVTSGMYAHVRHPLYLSEAVAGLGALVIYFSIPALLLFLSHLAFQVRRTAHEERVLEAAFPEYGKYRVNTWRLLPGIY